MSEFKYLRRNPQYWLFAFLWVLIVLPKYIQLVVLTLFASFLYSNSYKKFKFNKVAIAMLCLFFVHLFAILFNVLFLSGDLTRIAAALNTASLWCLAAFYVSYYSISNINMMRVGKYCCINLFVLGVLALLTIYLYYFKGYSHYILLGRDLYGTTYIDGRPTTKFFGLNDFSNINLFFIMLMFSLSVLYLKTCSKCVNLLMICVVVISVAVINSRSGFVLFGVGLLMYFVFKVPQKYFKICLLLLVFIGLVFLCLFFDKIINLFISKILFGNISSNSYRWLLIKTSFNEALSNSPIWGLGIKRYLDEGYPLGSHSSYVGFFYKTGLIGFLLGVYIFIKANKQCFKNIIHSNGCKPVVVFFMCFVVLFAIEDVDGTNWSIILYFSSLAMLAKINSKKITVMEKQNENANISNILTTVLSK